MAAKAAILTLYARYSHGTVSDRDMVFSLLARLAFIAIPPRYKIVPHVMRKGQLPTGILREIFCRKILYRLTIMLLAHLSV